MVVQCLLLTRQTVCFSFYIIRNMTPALSDQLKIRPVLCILDISRLSWLNMIFLTDARYDSYAARQRETQEESRLLTYLMENYDREVRPVYNASHPVEVKVGITLTQIFDMVSLY